MNEEHYQTIENYMRSCMEDSAHDQEHVYRVLNTVLLIAQSEPEADREVLVCAALLHDIGRKEQFENPALCHARVGGEKAFRFLLQQGYGEEFAGRVRDCIASHRYRENNQPQTLEAKILFDADKLDAAGAMGIARTLLYQGHMGTPLYTTGPDGLILEGTGENTNSFFQEYKFKLEKLYDRFYTQKGKELAMERRKTAVRFYEGMLREVQQSRNAGKVMLDALLRKK
ncbi:MAG: HD domain-containing protein [Oscillospiraceae bacterium]|nr:HD domain-containing protein [Oscillospiraceae bacterium]